MIKKNLRSKGRLITVMEMFLSYPLQSLLFWCLGLAREKFNVDDPSQDAQALQLLEQIISFLQGIAQQNTNVVERLRLQHIGVKMVSIAAGPLMSQTFLALWGRVFSKYFQIIISGSRFKWEMGNFSFGQLGVCETVTCYQNGKVLPDNLIFQVKRTEISAVVLLKALHYYTKMNDRIAFPQ